MKNATKLLAVVVGLILFLSGALFLRSKVIKPIIINPIFDNVQFSASQKSLSGVNPQSSIILASSQFIDPAAVSQTIRITPEVDYSIKKINDNSVEVNFQKPLEKSTVYQISLDRSKWAFQVESPLTVTGSLPRDKTIGVKLNTPIEFYLNNPEFIESAEKYFEIQPPIAGRFEKHQNSLVFIPSSLSPNTLYTVTLKQGFPLTDNSQKLEKNFSIKFETGSSEKIPVRRFDFLKSITESTPDQAPVIILNNWDPPSSKVKAKIYQFNNFGFESCLREKITLPLWSTQNQYHRCKVTGSSISEFELDVRSTSEYGSKYLELPSKLALGYYALEIDNPDSSISQTLIEVSPISWYYWIGQEDSLFWINDMSVKKPASNVKLSVGSKELGVSNGDGIVKISTSEELKPRQNQILTLKTPSFTAYNLINYQNQNSPVISKSEIEKNKFWSYLYTDREIYLPTDKVNFWGVIKSRSSEDSEKITIELSRNYYNYWSEELSSSENSIKKIEITPSPQGTLQGNFDFSDLSPGYYNLIVKKGNTYITQHGFLVETFKKPVFRITAVPQNLVAWAGQTNKINLSVKFYDGTPVPGTPLIWTMWDGNGDKKGEIVTDSAGNASLDVPTIYDSLNNYWPQNVSVDFRPKGMQEGEINTYTSFFIFGPEYNLTVDSGSLNNQMQITAVVRKNDLNLLEKSPQKKEGEPVINQPVSIKTDRVWYDKVEIGDYYDPINKTTSKRYRYDRKTEEISNQNLTTDNQGKIIYSQPIISGQQYEALVSITDSQNRIAKSTVFVYGSDSSSANKFSGKVSKEKYSINDPIELSLNYNNDLVPETEPNKYLVFFVRNGKVFNTIVSEKNKYSFQFGSDYIPNVILKSVWFNGSVYRVDNNWRGYSQNGLNLTLDTATKELKIDAKTDKAKYQPGEEANIELSVKNSFGQLQPNTKILLSVVDESLSDIGGISSPGILSSLYYSLGEGRLTNYVSNQSPDETGMGAEGGGGGGDNRSIFKNTTVFTELTTDATGMARYKFKLPDNITSWRATVVAVSKDLSAGDSQILIPVTKPLFIDVVTNDEFIVSDRPKISAVAHGDGLDSNSEIKYSLNAPSLGINITNISQKAFIPLDFDIGRISVGEHRLEIKATSGSFKDGLIKNINVVNSRNLLPRQEIINLDKEYKPAFVSQRPVYFTFIDKGLSSLYPKLKQLTELNSYGHDERSDRLAAENIANQLISQYFSEEPRETESDFSRYFPEKGVALLPSSDADLILTAKFAAASLPLINKFQLSSALTSYYQQETSAERISAALWGLSEVGEPVLNTLDLLSKEKNTPRGQIYLGLAFAAQGDQMTARRIFDEIISKYGVKQDPLLYIKIDNNEQNIPDDTALMMILSAKIGSIEDQNKLWSYLDIAKSENQIYVLEKAIALKSSINAYSPSPSEFEYILSGKKHSQTLSGGKIFTVIVPKNELSGFSATSVSGSVSLIARWWESFDPAKISVNQNISVNISTNPQNILSNSGYMEFFVTPKISKETTKELYLITVNLPSGLRFVDNPASVKTLTGKNEFYSWPVFQENNRLVFRSDFKYPIRFLARPVNKGQFSFEPSLIYSSDTINQLNVSNSHLDITIN